VSEAAVGVVVSPQIDPFAMRRDILRLAWPVVLQGLLRTTMLLVDTYMLGHYGTPAQAAQALATIAVVAPLVFGIMDVLGALGTGTLATVARATGARDTSLQEQEVATSLTLAAGLGLMGLTYGPLGTLLAELFPTSVRYTGSSLTFNLAGIFGASLAPYIATWLANNFGLQYVGYYLTAAAALTLLGLLATQETRHRDLAEI